MHPVSERPHRWKRNVCEDSHLHVLKYIFMILTLCVTGRGEEANVNRPVCDMSAPDGN